MTQQTNTIEIEQKENLIYYKDSNENNLRNFNKWRSLIIDYSGLMFKCELVKIKVYDYPIGFYGYYNVYFNDVLKSSVRIPLNLRFNAMDLLLNNIKEDRLLKGLITRELNKRYKLKRALK